MTPSRPFGLAASIGAALALAGCISLFPKAPPVQLYRFDPDVSASAPTAASARRTISVRESPLDFASGGSGDRIMTVRGNEIAYIAGARWDEPADRLFQNAVARAFSQTGGPVRLVEPGQPSAAQYRLSVEVTRFEVDYGGGAAPQIQVTVKATLTRESDLSFVGEQTFDVTQPAEADRVGAIVDAFKAATAKAVQDLAGWANQTVASAPSAS